MHDRWTLNTLSRPQHDERSAGYYAVGYAKARGVAAAVIVTSGTAVANLLPSVVEASQQVPSLHLMTYISRPYT